MDSNLLSTKSPRQISPSPRLTNATTHVGMVTSNLPSLATAGVGVEKQAVVLDFGQRLTKAGFAGEAAPRVILETPQLSQVTTTGQPIIRSVQEWRSLLNPLVRGIFHCHLLAAAKDRKVVLLDDLHTPDTFRHAVVAVLYEEVQAIAVSFLPRSIGALYNTGISTGLVVDVGYSDSRVLAVISGHALLVSSNQVKIGGQLVDSLLVKRIQKNVENWNAHAKRVIHSLEKNPESAFLTSPNASATQAGLIIANALNGLVLEEVKLGGCYVKVPGLLESTAPSLLHPEEDAGSIQLYVEASDNELDLERFSLKQKFLSVKNAVVLKAHERSLVYEPFFWDETALTPTSLSNNIDISELESELQEECLAGMILKAILTVPIESRKFVAQNILLTGGAFEANGFQLRLAVRMRQLVETDNRFERLKPISNAIAFAEPNCSTPLTMAWCGGSIYGSLDGAPAISIDTYNKLKQQSKDQFSENFFPLPDYLDPLQHARLGPYSDRSASSILGTGPLVGPQNCDALYGQWETVKQQLVNN